MAGRENFESLYSKQSLSSFDIIGYKEINPSLGFFRDLYIDLDSLFASMKPEEDRVPGWFIFADVLRISSDFIVLKNLVIYARRIEVQSDAMLILDNIHGKDQIITIFAQEIIHQETNAPGRLKLVKLNIDESTVEHNFEININEYGAVGIEWEESKDGGAKKLVSGNSDPAYLHIGEPLYLLLTTLFHFGTVISADKPELAINQFKWIASLASSNKNTFDLAADAHSFAMDLVATQAAGPNASLVPVLDLQIYSNDAQAYMALLIDRESYWNMYKFQTDMTELFLQNIITELALKQNEADLDKKLEEQAKDNLFQVSSARKIATMQLSSKLNETMGKKFKFQGGIENWKNLNTGNEIINIVTGVVTILLEIPAMVVAGPQLAALPIIETIEDAGKIVIEGIKIAKDIFGKVSRSETLNPEIKEVGEKSKNFEVFKNVREEEKDFREESNKIEEEKKNNREESKDKEEKKDIKEEAKKKREEAINNIMKASISANEGAEKIIKSVFKIAEISSAAEAMSESADDLLNLASGTVQTAFSTYDVQGLDVVTGGSQDWDNLALDLDDIFSNIPVLSEINGGKEYQLELRKLIICGKTLSMSKLSEAKAKTEYAAAIMKTKSKQKSVEIVGNRIRYLEDKKKQDDTISQIIFYRVLDAKRSVYSALESYRRAYKYFTLANEADLPVLPKFNDASLVFKKFLAQISSKTLQLNELAKLNVLPQSIVNLNIVFNDESTLANLRNFGITSFEINTNDSNFNGFGRVRFNCVRIFVQGIDKSEDKKIRVDIATSGTYLDIKPSKEDKVEKFLSLEVKRSFVYTAITQTIVIDGNVAPRYENDYFMPTPFTTWTIQVKYQSEEPLDYSRITGFVLSFTGEVTAR